LRELSEQERSDMQIYTDTALAAVRGTIFGMAISQSGTIISLSTGEIEVGRITAENDGIPFLTDPSVTFTGFTASDNFVNNGTG
jgi:hypothetical protein